MDSRHQELILQQSKLIEAQNLILDSIAGTLQQMLMAQQLTERRRQENQWRLP